MNNVKWIFLLTITLGSLNCHHAVRGIDDAGRQLLRTIKAGKPKATIPKNISTEEYFRKMELYILENADDIPAALAELEKLKEKNRANREGSFEKTENEPSLGERWKELHRQDSIYRAHHQIQRN